MTTLYMHDQKTVKICNGCNGSVGSSEHQMVLDYFIYETEEKSDYLIYEIDKIANKSIDEYICGISYGIGIARKEGDEYEEKFVDNVTNDYSEAMLMLKMLTEYTVTPCTLTDVLEDMVAEKSMLICPALVNSMAYSEWQDVAYS